jgi:hypothetical protein
MLCASVIGLAALSFASLGLFVWCWLRFKDDSENHPIYKANYSPLRREVQVEKSRHKGAVRSCRAVEVLFGDYKLGKTKLKRGLLQW